MSTGTEIKAIETRYNGYRFRSRLEARWAVFFDALGVPYQYEAEGFELPGGPIVGVEPDRYLPDFWLPTWRAFVEIKPGTPGEDEFRKAVRLSVALERRVLMLCGSPWVGDYTILDLTEYQECAERRWDEFAQCRRCDGVCLQYADSGWAEIGPHTCGDHDKWPLTEPRFAPRLHGAYLAARGARFEYRESPSVARGECPECKGIGWLRLDVPTGHKDFGRLVRCHRCS